MKLKEIAQYLAGKLVGDSELEITGAASLLEAQKGQITFAISSKYLKLIEQT